MTLRDSILYTVLLIIAVIFLIWGVNTSKTPQSLPAKPSQREKRDPELKPKTTTTQNSNETHTTQVRTGDEEDTYRVTRVIDGDTFTIDTGSTVRMIGMNTPELYPRDGSTQECFAPEATARTVELIFQKNVRLVRDVSDTDRYGRLLRYVYVDDTFVNKELVVGGFARVKAYKPDTKHHKELLAAMRGAQDTHKGLWGACK